MVLLAQREGKSKYLQGDILECGIEIIEKIKPTSDKKGYICTLKCPKCEKTFQDNLYRFTRKENPKTSCGCDEKTPRQRHMKDLTNKRFGHLTVKGLSQKQKKHPNGGFFLYWKCLCDCGAETIVSTSHLTTGHTASCGRCCISRGEDRIKGALEELKISYVQQKTFEGCKNPKTNTKLRFDFYLPDYNCCIEYDGEQHFYGPRVKSSTRFTQEEVEKIQERDKIKDIFCSKQKINLIRIPYWDFDEISPEYLKDLCYLKQNKGL